MATATRFDKLKTAANELVNVYRSYDQTSVSKKLENFKLILNEADNDSEKEARLILSVAQFLCLEFRKAFPEDSNNHQYYVVLYNSLISISKRLKIIIWLLCARSVSQQNVGEFYFPSSTDEPLFTINIDSETILKRSISVKSVIELLDLSPNTNPNQHATDIIVNRTEVCSEHLMYCTVALTTEQLSDLEEKVLDMYKNVIQNRYGCAVVKFRIQPYLNKESVKFFNLGTKQFSQECMQMVLVHDEESIDSSPWKVFCEGKGFLSWVAYSIDDLQDEHELDLEEFKEIKPIADFKWELKYTENYWTHPTFIFVNKIKFPEFVSKSESLPEFELEFEKHQCIVTNDGRRKLCLDCNLFRNPGGNVYVTKVDIINNQETLSNVSVPIRKYIKKTDQFKCSPEFEFFVFAMSLPVSNRDEFLKRENEGRYIVNQLDQIQIHWENAPKYYSTDWRLEST